MKRDAKLFLSDIVQAANYILEFTKKSDYEVFIADEKTKSAVLRKLEIIGEAAKRVPDDIKKKNTHIPWRAMAGMRDYISHAYFGIDYKLVWQTVQKDVNVIREDVSTILINLDQEN